jgi:hypothetical protein
MPIIPKELKKLVFDRVGFVIKFFAFTHALPIGNGHSLQAKIL